MFYNIGSGSDDYFFFGKDSWIHLTKIEKNIEKIQIIELSIVLYQRKK